MAEKPHNLGIDRFRILVIGNANAGKTTIMKTVCHAQGRDPVCLDDKGNKIDLDLEPSVSRGEHDIGHQFQYPTAHGFVFHDSRGFEAGGADELKKVKDFIEIRAKSEQLKDQLHVIWYCLTTSNDRAMTEAEMSFFESGTGDVPVIAVFTKMDALDEEARNQLLCEEVSFAKLEEQVPIRAKVLFERNYLQLLDKVKHKPHYVIQLRDMDKKDANCNNLILKTSEVLNDKTLNLFCLSIIRNNMETYIKYAINQIIIPKAKEMPKSGALFNKTAKSFFCNVMNCFPHMLPNNNFVSYLTVNALILYKNDFLLILHRLM
jgi:GTPase SAR1 family protein